MSSITRPEITRIRGRKLQAIRGRWLHHHPLCVHCAERGRVTVATEIDHIVPLERGGPDDDSNRQGLCHDCHALKTTREAGRATSVHYRPSLPKPNCRVRLVCGPPGAGKSTYVKQHRAPEDLVVDLDDIAREMGYGRNRPDNVMPAILEERNRRLAALALEPVTRTAWVIMTAPSPKLRAWWCGKLGVCKDDCVLLAPDVVELRRRIFDDPDRIEAREQHMRLINRWFQRERSNNPGLPRQGFDAKGYPLDPGDRWNEHAFALAMGA